MDIPWRRVAATRRRSLETGAHVRYVPIRAALQEARPSDDDDYPDVLAALGTLRAKARETPGSTEMFLRAATERDRRRNVSRLRKEAAKAAEVRHAEAVAEAEKARDAAEAAAPPLTPGAKPPRTARARAAEAQKRREAREAVERADAAVADAEASAARARVLAEEKPKSRPRSSSRRRPRSAAGSRSSSRGASSRRRRRERGSPERPASKPAEFAPPSGSYQLPGAGERSRFHRLDRDLRKHAPRVKPVDLEVMVAPLDESEFPSAPWREVPLRPQDLTADVVNETILFRRSDPSAVSSEPPASIVSFAREAKDALAEARSRPALEPAVALRSGTLLDDPRPYVYSGIRAAHPLGGRKNPEPPHPMPAKQPYVHRGAVVERARLSSRIATSELRTGVTRRDAKQPYRSPADAYSVVRPDRPALAHPERRLRGKERPDDSRSRRRLLEEERDDPVHANALAMNGGLDDYISQFGWDHTTSGRHDGEFREREDRRGLGHVPY